MRKEINKVLPVLLAVLFVAVCARPATAALPSMEEKVGMVEPAQEKNIRAPAITRPQITYKAADTRDPFEKYSEEGVPGGGQSSRASASSTPPTLVVEGLIWGGRLPQAIINGQVVKIGDTLGDVRITNITKDGVTVLFRAKEFKLSSPAGAMGTQGVSKKDANNPSGSESKGGGNAK